MGSGHGRLGYNMWNAWQGSWTQRGCWYGRSCAQMSSLSLVCQSRLGESVAGSEPAAPAPRLRWGSTPGCDCEMVQRIFKRRRRDVTTRQGCQGRSLPCHICRVTRYSPQFYTSSREETAVSYSRSILVLSHAEGPIPRPSRLASVLVMRGGGERPVRGEPEIVLECPCSPWRGRRPERHKHAVFVPRQISCVKLGTCSGESGATLGQSPYPVGSVVVSRSRGF